MSRFVVPVGQDTPFARRVETGHQPHQARLAGLRGAEQHGDRSRHEPKVERIQMRGCTDLLLDTFEGQFH